MANLIDGRAIAEKVYVDLRKEIADLKARGLTPGLAVVLIGDDPASRAYVRSKDKMSRELGLHSVKLELPVSTTQAELLARDARPARGLEELAGLHREQRRDRPQAGDRDRRDAQAVLQPAPADVDHPASGMK